jgi:glutaredoxin
MSNSFRLYTQNDCPYCTIMKKKLDSWGLTYETINISYNIDGKLFLKENGHRTVPQLYYDNIHLNKVDTKDFTRSLLFKEVQLHHDGQDWGVESFA